MSGSYRRFIITFAVCVFVSAAIWWCYSPRPPILPLYADAQAQAVDYQAGGSNCRPHVLARLTGDKAASEANRCKEADEEHRLKINDLIQQTRAADAAQAAAMVGFDATKIALAGLIGGMLTLVAAGFAAYYARRTYLQARDSFEMSVRPYVYIEDIEVKEVVEREIYRVEFKIRNCGDTPAIGVKLLMSSEFLDSNVHDSAPNFEKDSEVMLESIPPREKRSGVMGVIFTPEQFEQLMSHKLTVWLYVKLTFDSRFRKDKVVNERRFATGEDFLNAQFYISVAPKDRTPSLFNDEIRSDKNDEDYEIKHDAAPA